MHVQATEPAEPMKPADLGSALRDRAFSVWLDVIRATAAFAVLYGHARVLLMCSITPETPSTVVSRTLYFLSGFGHQAVIIFFVLSGYLVGGTVIRTVAQRRWSWRRYLLQRGTRLYIVLLPALLLTLAWDRGERLMSAGKTPNDDTAVANIRSETIQAHGTVGALIGNAVFLQTVFVPSFGSNTPLWSLANEFWYYIVFPLLWIAVAGRQVHAATRVVYVLAASSLLVVLGRAISGYFLIWLLGVLIACLPECRWFNHRGMRVLASAVTLAFFLFALLAVGAGKVASAVQKDVLIATTFTLVLLVLRSSPRRAGRALRRSATAFAGFSYTLYLVHLPPLTFLRACLTFETAWRPVATNWILLLLILTGVALYAYLLSRVTEAQTERLRTWIERRFDIGSRADVLNEVSHGGIPLVRQV
jgi:peptidoglycan/LPS O-acetylase OafA/YrhL